MYLYESLLLILSDIQKNQPCHLHLLSKIIVSAVRCFLSGFVLCTRQSRTAIAWSSVTTLTSLTLVTVESRSRLSRCNGLIHASCPFIKLQNRASIPMLFQNSLLEFPSMFVLKTLNAIVFYSLRK